MQPILNKKVIENAENWNFAVQVLIWKKKKVFQTPHAGKI